jgi:flagellar export protein FliJ
LNPVRRFQFRLQRVLQWQERVCRIEEDKLRACMAAVEETGEKLERLAAERVAIEQEFSSQPALAPPDLQALAAFRHKTVLDRKALEQERQDREAALDSQRQKLLAERRRLQVIEKLRERALDEHTRAADKEMEALSQESYLSTWISRTAR